jgi:uncharacterized protein (TIGR02145 family)
MYKMIYKIAIQRTAILLILSLFIVSSCKKAKMPTVTTETINRIQQTNAYGGGQISNDGGAHISKMGVCWSSTPDPKVSDNKTQDTTYNGFFTSHITGLTPNTMYYVKAYATNSEGTAYGNMVSFTTEDVSVPTLMTTSIKSLSLTTAASGGDISNDGGVPVTARGVCWNTTGSPTITDSYTSDGSGAGIFTSTLTDMTIGTTYYIRAYATNSLGTAYGNEMQFIQTEPVLDQNGNAYSVVTIGTQVWLGENLKATTLNDGTALQNITSGNNWATTTTPAYCWYNNDESTYKPTFGAIYNWFAVSTGKLCPVGWHAPTDEEYSTMMVYLGGLDIAGGKLKETGTSHWLYPNLGATNESSFTALPAGGRYNLYSQEGTFSDLGYFGYYWTSTVGTNSYNAFSYDISFNLNSVLKHEYGKNDGGSVRCLKDSK